MRKGFLAIALTLAMVLAVSEEALATYRLLNIRKWSAPEGRRNGVGDGEIGEIARVDSLWYSLDR